IFAQGAERCAGCACNGDTAADTGESCYQSRRDITESFRQACAGSSGLCGLYVRSAEHHDGCKGEGTEEEEGVYADGTFVAFLVFLADQIVSERNDDA